jgi:predicted unusual protein kinase regulating ubiquinone biosynthesis (AarF/ABC1/UbiB family)
VGIASDWLLREEELVYDLSDPVGSGGFAQVFRGKYRGQDVAVKVIHQNLLDNEER